MIILLSPIQGPLCRVQFCYIEFNGARQYSKNRSAKLILLRRPLSTECCFSARLLPPRICNSCTTWEMTWERNLIACHARSWRGSHNAPCLWGTIRSLFKTYTQAPLSIFRAFHEHAVIRIQRPVGIFGRIFVAKSSLWSSSFVP